MEVLEAIRRRRTIKQFAPEPVPQATIQALLELAHDAPTGGNNHPRQFVVATERETLDRLAETHRHCAWLKSATAAIAFLGDPTKSRYWVEDNCVAAQNVWLGATALGLGSAWSAIYLSDNPEESSRRESYVREVLGIPASLRVPLVLGLGFPAAPPSERKQPALDEMVHWGTYGARGEV